MGLYNVQTVNGAIATVELTDEEAERQGYGPEKRVDIVEDKAPIKAAAKGRARSRNKAASAPRNKAKAPAADKAVEVTAEQILAENDTTAAAVHAPDSDPGAPEAS